MKFAIVGVLALLLGSGLISACGGSPTFSGEVVIFVAGPMSGDQADGGQSVLGGVRKRADEANRAGGVLGGKKIVVRALDDQADEEVAQDAARAVERAVKAGEAVLGVVGHYNSGPTSKALEIYKNLNLVVVTPSSSNPDLTRKGYNAFFRVCATDATQGPFVARFLQEKGFNRVVLMHTDNEYAEGLAKEFKAGGGKPAAEIRMKAEATTYAKEVSQAKAANPDAIFFAGDYPDGIILTRELRQAGVGVPVVASDANFVDDFIDQLGSMAEGVFISAISPDPRAVAPKEWFEGYKDLEARNPGIDSTTGYSAADVLVTGVTKAGKLEKAAVASAIRALDLKTLVGRVRYDQQGDLVEQKVYVFQISGGRFQQAYPRPGE